MKKLSPKRILYINHYAGSPESGMEYRPYYLSSNWIKNGNEVLVVAGSFSHLRKVNRYFSGISQNENVDGIPYLWLKIPTYKGNGLLRFVNIFAFITQLFVHLRILIKFRPDLVIASSTYPLDTIPALVIGRISGAKVIHEIHDLWPLTLIELHKIPPFHPLIILFSWAEKLSYRNVDKVVSMLPGADAYLSKKGMQNHKYVLIPNGYNPEKTTQPLPLNFFSCIEKIKDHTFVAYAGYFGKANAIDDLLHAAEKLINEKIYFLMVGDGPELENIKKMAAEKNIKMIFFPKISKNEIPSFLNRADICYIGWKNSPLYKFGISPNKLIDYMAAGKPIVHATSSTNDLVKMAKCGVSVNAEDADNIAMALKSLSNLSKAELKELGTNGQTYLKSHLDYSVLSERFLDSVFSR